MKYRHRLMFIPRSTSASSSIPCLLLPGACSSPAVPRQLCCTTVVMLSRELGTKANREDHGRGGRTVSKATPLPKQIYINQGWYQSYLFVLHRGYMRNIADFTCITRSVCPTVTNLFQTGNKYFNTNLNRSQGDIS